MTSVLYIFHVLIYILYNSFLENINECVSIPCLNGGTCNDSVNGYMCEFLRKHGLHIGSSVIKFKKAVSC